MAGSIFRVNERDNTLSGPGGSTALGHHRAGQFLAALVRCQQAGTGLSRAAFLQAWQATAQTLQPDRTALARVTKAVRDGLMSAGSASQLANAPRKATVGPWHLLCAEDEQWQVDDDAPAGLAALRTAPPRALCMTEHATPQQMLQTLLVVIVADDLARQAQYGAAIQHLQDNETQLQLSPEGKALFSLRQIRWLRRLGLRMDAKRMLAKALTQARNAHPAARADLLAEYAMQTARTAYDSAPYQHAGKIDFDDLAEQITLAGSARLRWEAANLKALACRRRLQAVLARGVNANIADAEAIAQEAMDAFREAFYWLVVDDDPYHLQSVMVNYAFHLQYLMHQASPQLASPTIGDVVEAWHICQTVVEKYDLPEDSAWDYIMLSDLWFGQADARKIMQTDWRLWPKDRSPANLDFYQRGVELAHASGDARQRFLALDRCAAFMNSRGMARELEPILHEQETMLATHPELPEQLTRERLWGPLSLS